MSAMAEIPVCARHGIQYQQCRDGQHRCQSCQSEQALAALTMATALRPEPPRTVFTARYDGHCGGGDLISAGEQVCHYGGETWHEDCAARDCEPPSEPLCDECWTYHRGECL